MPPMDLKIELGSHEQQLMFMGAAHIYALQLSRGDATEEERLEMARQSFLGATALVVAAQEMRKTRD